MASLLPIPEPADPVEGALGHFEHTNWVKQALKNLDAGTVHIAGGAGGALTFEQVDINKSTDETATLNLVGNSTKSIFGLRGTGVPPASRRWQLQLGDATAEGGNNSGSLFALTAFRDDGAPGPAVMYADRQNGLVAVAGAPIASNGVATKQYVDDAMPIGAVIGYGGSSAPTGWLICNGLPIPAQYTTLIQRVGANTPDLASRFVVGVGQGVGLSNYPVGAKSVGNTESVKLKATESGLPLHKHVASTQAETQEHKHWVDPAPMYTETDSQNHTHHGITGFMDRNASHTHDAKTYEGITTGDSDKYLDTADYAAGENWNTVDVMATDTNHRHVFDTEGVSNWHQHRIDIPGFWSDGRSATHTHGVTVNDVAAADASLAHENRPPYYALLYIIKAL